MLPQKCKTSQTRMEEIRPPGQRGKERTLGRPSHPEADKWQPFFSFHIGYGHHLLFSTQDVPINIYVCETEILTSLQSLSSLSSLETESLSYVHSGP